MCKLKLHDETSNKILSELNHSLYRT